MADIKINLGAPAALNVKPAGPAAPASPVVMTAATAAPKPAGPVMAAAPKPAVATAPKPAAQPASFQNIFTQAAAKTAGPKMLESVVSGKTTVASKLKPILGSAPQLQKTLEQEKEYRQKRGLRTSQVIFVIILLLSFGASFYFFTELSPTFSPFGQNTTSRLTEINKSLRGLQTKMNTYRYLIAQTKLNQFSYVAEQYLDKTAKLNDPTVSDVKKATLTADISELQTQIPTLLQDIRKVLTPDIILKLSPAEGEEDLTNDQLEANFEADLKASLENEKAAAPSENGTISSQELKLINNAIKLVGNSVLIGSLKGISTDTLDKDMTDYKATLDPVLRDRIQNVFSSILASTSSDIATIASLKAARVSWSTVIKQIGAVTKNVDPNFDLDTFRDDLINVAGGINYESFEFDSVNNKISVSGTTKTTDDTNFTMISDLIDQINSSDYFKGAGMLSFSKSGSADEGYTANVTLDFTLKTAIESAKSKTISLVGDILKQRTGHRRIKK